VYESGDGKWLEFLMGERQVDVINSTELRLAGFDLAPIGFLPVCVAFMLLKNELS
jgi:hypothetical protein